MKITPKIKQKPTQMSSSLQYLYMLWYVSSYDFNLKSGHIYPLYVKKVSCNLETGKIVFETEIMNVVIFF